MKNVAILGFAGLGLVACTVPPPSGPTVLALPPQGKDYGQFQREDLTCQQSAAASIGYANPSAAATNAAVGSAAVGTAMGAAAGALIGAAAGDPGAGAAIGAGTGLFTGSIVGANNASATTYGMQARLNAVYAQCMTAYGNTVEAPPVAPAVTYYAAPYYPYPAYPYPFFFGPSVSFYGGYGYWGPRGWWGRPHWGPPHRRW